MKMLIRLEELALAGLSLFLFLALGYEPWWYVVWLLAPDLGMVGYLFGPAFGATLYNLVHHKGMAVTAYVVGSILQVPPLQAAGMVVLGHSSLDRVFGYGLKHMDSFAHTHLGTIGRQNR